MSPVPPAIPPVAGLTFHHFGVACRDLTAETGWWSAMGYVPVGPVHRDPLQGVELQFLEGGGPRVELIAPLPGSLTLEPYLRAGSRLYHVGYVAENFDEALAGLSKLGRLASPPKVAVAFDGARVAFVLLKNLLLVELIESPTRHDR